ncbi:hypothetical protein GCM10025855_42730 [Shewanella glacialipiscicola]|uniref:EAL domain-containing protein n=1 Tax=Shewanella glacialipiscicola TaxID=614069 RepID=A0ABQ6JB89_9GAMM|nr:hypothetical protein GCM10025855_42730 [Shewanella glacialipiscicola]
MGAGYSGLRTWSELKPDFVKLDRHFMQNIHEDRQKRQFVQSMIDIAQSIGCQVIGEGIEVRQEYHRTKSGYALCTGYYFGRPNRNPQKELDNSLFAQRKETTIQRTGRPRANTLVSSLLTDLDPVRHNDTIEHISDRFQKALKLNTLPVVDDNNRVVGIMWRDDLKLRQPFWS